MMSKTTQIETPLGSMVASGDEECLHSLLFGTTEIRERARSIQMIEEELEAYFAGGLKEFKTPLFLQGTPFQKKVWRALRKVPYGEVCSYGELAQAVGKPKAYRAVGTANGKNSFPIIIPCHRVVHAGGGLGGYSCGLDRKKWLLDHEKKSNRR